MSKFLQCVHAFATGNPAAFVFLLACIGFVLIAAWLTPITDAKYDVIMQQIEAEEWSEREIEELEKLGRKA